MPGLSCENPFEFKACRMQSINLTNIVSLTVLFQLQTLFNVSMKRCYVPWSGRDPDQGV